MAKFTSKSANIYDDYLGMSSMYQNMSSWMPVLKSWQFPQHIFIFTNISIQMAIIL